MTTMTKMKGSTDSKAVRILLLPIAAALVSLLLVFFGGAGDTNGHRREEREKSAIRADRQHRQNKNKQEDDPAFESTNRLLTKDDPVMVYLDHADIYKPATADDRELSTTTLFKIEVSITPDDKPEEIAWSLGDGVTNEILASGTTEGATVYLTYGLYWFELTDAGRDGICCTHGSGMYRVFAGLELIASGGEFNGPSTGKRYFRIVPSDNPVTAAPSVAPSPASSLAPSPVSSPAPSPVSSPAPSIYEAPTTIPTSARPTSYPTQSPTAFEDSSSTSGLSKPTSAPTKRPPAALRPPTKSPTIPTASPTVRFDDNSRNNGQVPPIPEELPVVTVGFVLLPSSQADGSAPTVDKKKLGDMLEFFMYNLLILATTTVAQQQDNDIQLSLNAAVSYAPSSRQGLVVIKGTWVDPRLFRRLRGDEEPLSDLLRHEFSQTGIRDLYQLFQENKMAAQFITVQVDGRPVQPVQEDLQQQQQAPEEGTTLDSVEKDDDEDSTPTLLIVLALVVFCLAMLVMIVTLVMRRHNQNKQTPAVNPTTIKEKDDEKDDRSTAKLGAVSLPKGQSCNSSSSSNNKKAFGSLADENSSSLTVVPGGGGSEWYITTSSQGPVSVLGDGESTFGGDSSSVASPMEHHLALGGAGGGEDNSTSTAANQSISTTEKQNETSVGYKNSPGRGVSALLRELGLGNLTTDEKHELHQTTPQEASTTPISLYDPARLGWNS